MDILQLTKDLIKIPSESQNVKELHHVVDFVYDIFNDEDVFVEKIVHGWKPSLIVQNFEGKESDIILSGHLDVVPASMEGQFYPYEQDWKLYGRWSGDMKSGCAIKIAVMKKLLEEKYDEKKICLMLTTDEELWGMNGVEWLVFNGYRGGVVLILDGGQWHKNIVINEKWALHMTIKIKWKSCHASRPWLWDNAIEKLYCLYEELKNLVAEEAAFSREDHWGTTVVLSVINWWMATNVVPGSVEAKFDIRFTEKYENVDELFAYVDKLVSKYDGKILSSLKVDALKNNEKDSYIQKYKDIAESIWGETVSLNNHHGGCDGRFFSVYGATVIVHQPNCENLHWKNEWVLISDLEKMARLYYKFIVS